MQNLDYLYDASNETKGLFVPAQILYDAFHGRYHTSTGAILFLCMIWGSFFFGGLSITTSAARVVSLPSQCKSLSCILNLVSLRSVIIFYWQVYALSRDGGIPYAKVFRKLHPKYKVPANAVWLSAFIAALLALPVLKSDVAFNAIASITTIGWVGGYAVPIFFRIIIPSHKFKPGPFHLGKASRLIHSVAFLWILYTCAVFLLPTGYPITWENFNYAPVALGVVLSLVMLWWFVDARYWFKGPVREVDYKLVDT